MKSYDRSDDRVRGNSVDLRPGSGERPMKSPCAALLGVAGLFAAVDASADAGEDIFEARCGLCHASGAAGAPRIGNRADWEPRVTRGRAALHETALKGKPDTAMKAKGGFRDLSSSDVRAAVDYMLKKAGFDPSKLPPPKAIEVAKVEAFAPSRPPASVAQTMINLGGPSSALPPKVIEVAKAEAAASTAPATDVAPTRTELDPGKLPGALPPKAIEVAKAEASAAKVSPADINDRTITEVIAEALRREVAPPGAWIEAQESAATVGRAGIKVETRMGVVILDGVVENADIMKRAEAIAKAVDGVKRVENKLIPASIVEWD